ncbi:MAG: hypothetical protein ACOYJQ_04975 [Pseudochelatococcus sp.]|jgi:hypothetical protein|uniref:hypothetical protein n=1 Tax=Pseudochelatococcus sp. TaxID=2020869 RepID=UPI003D91BF4D
MRVADRLSADRFPMPLKWRRALVPAGLAAAFLCVAPPARAAPPDEVSMLRHIGPALMACWKPPRGTEGLTATARFSFRSDGSLMGPPRITFARLGDRDARAREFLHSIADAFSDCTPLKFTPSFGRSVAGRIFTMRFIPAAERA